MLKKESVILAAFSAIFLLSIIMLLSQQITITGKATTQSTISNVTISKYLAIDLSTNLSAGITFGNVTSLPATDINASHNYDAGAGVNGTTMFVNISDDSNVAVDICINANTDLTDSVSGEIIAIGNESYSNSTSTNATLPPTGGETSLTTSYVWAGNESQGNQVYFRFWLDIPAGATSGDYNNTIGFKGVEQNSGAGC
jgi:hypothetical protein